MRAWLLVAVVAWLSPAGVWCRIAAPESTITPPPRRLSPRNAGGKAEEASLSSSMPWTKQLIEILPQVKVRVDPLTSLKIRKNFRWMRTVLSIGADYSTQLGTWCMKYSWEDTLIGGKLLFNGSELQLHKSWLFALGGTANLAANLRFRAALDIATGRVSARFGFRTEQNTNSRNIVDGIDLVKRVPLDGSEGHAKLEVKLRVAFPQPDIQLDGGKKADRGTAGQSASLKPDKSSGNDVYVGMGDLEIDVEELNLLLDW